MSSDHIAVLQELESLGTEQNRKTYRRHGAVDPLFGVSFAHLEKLRKRIKVDHALAHLLWESGNYDARIFAMMIADPAAMSLAEAERWVSQLDCYPVTNQLANLVAKSALGRKAADKWIKSKHPWTACAGWSLLSRLAKIDSDLDDKYLEGHLNLIQAKIHNSPDRVRHSMNGALIAIGCRNESLKTQALKVATAIGQVKVDHGQTACKTPNAAEYIHKVYAKKK